MALPGAFAAFAKRTRFFVGAHLMGDQRRALAAAVVARRTGSYKSTYLQERISRPGRGGDRP